MDVRDAALLGYAGKLTTLARPIGRADIEELRARGLDDEQIRDLAQVVGYFNYVNRHVDGLGLELEPDHPGRRWAELALGSERA